MDDFSKELCELRQINKKQGDELSTSVSFWVKNNDDRICEIEKQDDQLKAMTLQSYDDNFKIIRLKSKIQDMDEIIGHQKAKLDSDKAVIKMMQEEIKKLKDQVEALSK